MRKELENEHLRVNFAADGSFTIFDKDNQVEVFQPGRTGARAVLMNDPTDTWGHDITKYADEIGAFGGFFGPGTGERSPARRGARSVKVWQLPFTH